MYDSSFRADEEVEPTRNELGRRQLLQHRQHLVIVRSRRDARNQVGNFRYPGLQSRAVSRVAVLSEEPELRERVPFGAGWPKFIFRDAVALRLMPTVEQAFAEFSLAIVEDDDHILAGGWGVPEEMSEMAFPETGDYVVPQALTLVHIDLDADRGSYAEPAIWMQHA